METERGLLLLALAVSGAITILAASVLILAGVRAQSLTEGSRLRLVGMGYLFLALGTVSWLAGIITCVIRSFNMP